MNKYRLIHEEVKENRIDDLVQSLTIDIILQNAENVNQKNIKYIDENGDEQTAQHWDYESAPVISNRIINYNIPFEHQTNLRKGTEHPHNHEEEMKYQERFRSWVEGYQATEEYIAAMRDLNNKVL